MKHTCATITLIGLLFWTSCNSETKPTQAPPPTQVPQTESSPTLPEEQPTEALVEDAATKDVLIKEKSSVEVEKIESSKPSTAPRKLETPKSGTPSDATRELLQKVQTLKKVNPADGTPTSNGFTEVNQLDKSIRLDIRYATANNFTKVKIYDCPRCFLRPEPAEALVKAHKILQKKGLGLKMFDCYRPRPYQQRLWDKVPDPNYVTPPHKGSMHSRGAAVDLTIIDDKGKELDMGTEYDFFGVEAHTDYLKHSTQILENRKLLTETLAAVGFKGIRTEWWHFSFQGKDYPLSDYVWPCKN